MSTTLSEERVQDLLKENTDQSRKQLLDYWRSRYKSVSVERIQELLEKIQPVMLGHKGVGTMYGYYRLMPEMLAKLKENPRGISYQFNSEELGEYAPDLVWHKKIFFYVKSSSRFFLKPDIGEVFDQMSQEDIEQTDAICIVRDSQSTVNEEGDHFVMSAILLKHNDAA